MALRTASATALALRALAAGPAASGPAVDHSVAGQRFQCLEDARFRA